MDDVMAQWAKTNAPSVDLVSETEAFREYWGAKAGRDAVKVNWRLTWQTWMRRRHGWNVEKGWRPVAAARNETDAMLLEQQTAWCEAHGTTVAEYEARKHDQGWLQGVIARG